MAPFIFSLIISQLWMVVQRKWMYLEGIFIGGDIRSQLPEEAKKFDQIDKTFKKVSHSRTEQMNLTWDFALPIITNSSFYYKHKPQN